MPKANDEKDKASEAKPPETPPASAPPQPQSEKRRFVRVLVQNLGPRLYRQGEVTDDPDIVALLDTERGRRLVEEVK